ncbi:MAG: DNA gyrase subunit A, partial [Actinomycetota bacterium]
GLLVAIVDIDEVIELIRASDNAAEAKERLMTVFDLTEVQATYILDMPLRRLTKFSRIELEAEADELRSSIDDLQAIVTDDDRLRDVVSTELAEVNAALATPRRTQLREGAAPTVTKAAKSPATSQSSEAALEVKDEPCIVLLSSAGLIARTSAVTPAAATDDSRSIHDVITSTSPATTRGTVGALTTTGRVVSLDVVDLPSIPPVAHIPSLAAGAPLGAFVDLEPHERVVGLAPVDGTATVALGTRGGVVKRVTVPEPSARTRSASIIALDDGDLVVGATFTPEAMAENARLAFVTSEGNVLTFPAASVRVQGAGASGMAGISMPSDARAVFFGAVAGASDGGHQAMVVTLAGSSSALPGTELGSVKISPLSIFPDKGRATKGVRCHKLRASEDEIALAWVGPGPVRGATAAGKPVTLPAPTDKRDATGTPPSAPVAAFGGTIGP